ncbi:MAG: hypothetical protein D3906_12575, partial [Candidatus Electrothrix sp. AUS1_2]|nr:hypothetical protein [Candidatus Electrothrix sp. AUS1_2]
MKNITMTKSYRDSARVFTLIALLLIAITTGISHASENSLLYAVKSGDVDGVRDAIANGADVNTVVRDETALMAASARGYSEIANILIQKGAGVNVQQEFYNKRTALMMAVDANAFEIVEILLRNGANLDLVDYRKNTALSLAIQRNSVQSVRLLLSAGATISDEEITELAISLAKKGQWETVKLLIEKNIINSNTKTKREKTLLMIASEQGDAEAVEFLVDHHANISEQALFAAFKRKHCDVAKLLLDHPIKLTSKNKGKITPLMEASASGCVEVVKLLIDQGADVNRITTAKGEKGNTALFFAIEGNHIDVVKLLLEHKADTEIKDNRRAESISFGFYGRNETGTALTLSIILKQFDSVKELLEHGANIKATVKNKSVLQLAVESENINIVKILLKYGVDINEIVNDKTIFHLALKNGQPEIAKLLIDNGASVPTKGKSGAKLLIDILEKGYFDIAKILVLQGADVNAKQYRYKSKKTALIIASEKSYKPNAYEIVKLLVEKGADTNATDKDGNTALHYARDSQVVSYLLT